MNYYELTIQEVRNNLKSSSSEKILQELESVRRSLEKIGLPPESDSPPQMPYSSMPDLASGPWK